MGDNELIANEEEMRIFREKIKLKSNGVYHIEDVNVNVNDKLLEGIGSSSDRRLRKWKRIRRELVKKPGSNLNGSKIGDISNILVNVNGDSEKSEEDLSSRSSTAASVARIKHDEDLQKNGRIEPVKKARGVVIEKEKLSSTMGFDSRSVNFVFVQGTNTVASKGRQSGTFGKCDEVCSDAAYYGDKDLNEEVRVEFVKIDGESDDDDDDVLQEDVADENDWEVKDEKIGKHDPLVKSIKGLCFAHEEVEREVQKWKDIGKNDPLICDDPMHEQLEFQDAKILELESVLTSKDTKTEFEDTLKKIIQAEVEYIAMKTTTESLTAEMKHNLHQNNVLSQKLETTKDVKKQPNEMCLSSTNTQVLKKQAEKLETIEDVKKLQKRVSRFTLFFMIQLILLLVILYLKFSPQDVKIVPT